ncbi:hypothetical protein VdG1_09381 [Verticillium dahliae VDG1]|nr:hypothetical protein VdG1_09381 [Verticillium dahliae VDG1]
MQFKALIVSLLAVAAQAAPASPNEERSAIEKRATTCGSTYYTTAQVNAAANAACQHITHTGASGNAFVGCSGTTLG